MNQMQHEPNERDANRSFYLVNVSKPTASRDTNVFRIKTQSYVEDQDCRSRGGICDANVKTRITFDRNLVNMIALPMFGGKLKSPLSFLAYQVRSAGYEVVSLCPRRS